MRDILLNGVILFIITYLLYSIVLKLLEILEQKKHKTQALNEGDLPEVRLLIRPNRERAHTEKKMHMAVSMEFANAEK